MRQLESLLYNYITFPSCTRVMFQNGKNKGEGYELVFFLCKTLPFSLRLNYNNEYITSERNSECHFKNYFALSKLKGGFLVTTLWRSIRDLNSGPLVYKTSAATTELMRLLIPLWTRNINPNSIIGKYTVREVLMKIYSFRQTQVQFFTVVNFNAISNKSKPS